MRHSAHDDTPLLEQKKDRSAWVPYLAVALFLAIVGVIVLAILLANASSSSPTPGPAPVPWNPLDYQTAAEYYDKIAVHGINVEDNMRLLRVGAPILSKNGRKMVFTVTQSQMPDFKKRTTTLWGLSLSDHEHSWLNTTATPSQLTRPEWGMSDSSPQWGPDDKSVFFLSNRGENGTSQIWQTLFDHSPVWPNFLTTVQISHVLIDIDTFMVSPTFDLVMFSAQVYAGMNISESIAHDVMRKSFGGDSKTFDRLYVRHWDTWVEKRNQIFAASLASITDKFGFKMGDHHVNIVNMDSDAPTRPFGDSGEWSFSPDGKNFVFCRQHDEFKNVSWNTNDDIFLVNIKETTNPPVIGEPINLTPNNPARDTLPRFAPSGLKLAYVSMAVPGYESDRKRVKIYDLHSQETTVLTEAWIYSVDEVAWSSNSTYLMGTVLQDGELMLQRIGLTASTEGEHIITQGNAASPAQTPWGEWVFGFSKFEHPQEIHATDGADTHAVALQLTAFNRPMLDKCQTSLTTKFSFVGANNETVNGWITPPVGLQPKTKYPVAFLIHGGPQGAWEQGWSWRWNPQLYAGRGYAVVMVNFHGSSGYGQSFTDSIRGNYGSLPFEDLMKGLDYALDTYDYLDRARVAALGASYGGYMIYWIAGQAEENKRFKCLVSHDGMFDIRTFYYTTEELFFPEHDQPGTPFGNPENYEKYNPINYVANWSLPMLVIHGGLDYRITDSQGLGAFTALQRLGIPSQFLYFPTENHWVTNARNQLTWHTNVLNFIDNCTQAP